MIFSPLDSEFTSRKNPKDWNFHLKRSELKIPVEFDNHFIWIKNDILLDLLVKEV